MRFQSPLLLVLSLSFTACVDGAEPEDDVVYYDTVVEVSADGTTVVGEPQPITASERRAQLEARMAPPSTRDTSALRVGSGSCMNSSFWLYSRTDWTGSRICFSGPDSVELAAYSMYVDISGVPVRVGSWRIATGSYWAGTSGGRFFSRDDNNFPPIGWQDYFKPYARLTLNHTTPADYIFFE